MQQKSIWAKPELVTALRMSIAAALAFLIYTIFHLPEGYWAVVSIAAVTQAGLSGTVTKSAMRIIGTIIGAAFGYGLAALGGHNQLFIIIMFWIVITLSSYVAVQKSAYSYAGVIAGLTMVIVLSSSLIQGAMFRLAVYRSYEVALGIITIGVVTLIFDVLRCYALPKSQRPPWRKQIFQVLLEFKLRFEWSKLISAIKISLAASVTLITWLYFQYPYGFWATVTCLLIMEEGAHQTAVKGSLRFWAHIGSAIFGGICALVIHVHVYWLLFPLFVSFFACGYVIGSGKSYRTLGNTTGIALAIMLLAAAGTDETFSVVVARFLNVTYGIVVGLLITYYLFPRYAIKSHK